MASPPLACDRYQHIEPKGKQVPSAIAARRLSTATVPSHQRLAMWREVFGHAMAKLDIETRGDEQFDAEGLLCALPGAACASVTATPVTVTRTRRLISADPVEMLYLISADAPLQVSQAGQEQLVKVGDSIFVRGSEISMISTNRRCRFTNVAVAFDTIRAVGTAADNLAMHIIPRRHPVLGLLHGYVDTVCERPEAMEAAGTLCARHITELVAAIAEIDSRDEPVPDHAGVKAARLRAIKAEIAAQLRDPQLNIDQVAHRCGISARYIRLLFKEAGASFSSHVLGLRLDHAHRLLVHPGAPRTIATIAYACGFGDLSYFNRTFRQRFGMTPSELRSGRDERRFNN